MGGSQSTRQIVIDNDQNVVAITDDVHRRLLGLPEKAHSQETNPSGGVSVPHVSNEQLDAIRQRIEEEYRQRITVASSESHKVKAEEFARAVQEVEAKFIKQTGSPVCQDLQQEVYECYQNNLRQPLHCSKQVKAFVDAVDKARRNAIMTKQL